MTNSTKTHQLNNVQIRKALKGQGIKVLSCKNCTGSVKKAVYIVVSASDSNKAAELFLNIGVVGKKGEPKKASTTRQDYFDFGYCYMSDKVYNEINS